MAKKQPEKKVNINQEVSRLKQNGPARLYYLYGPEKYLRDFFLDALKKECRLENEEFNYKRFNGPDLDENDLIQAVDSMPFFAESTFIELRDIEIGKKNSDRLVEILSDIPEYCTVAFVQDDENEPDSRLKITKFLKEQEFLKFCEQDQGKLIGWIQRRFEAYGKSVDLKAASRLIFLSGSLMNNLIPEIEKIAAFCPTNVVSINDVNAIAVPVADAQVFDLTDAIADRRFDAAIDILADLLSNEDNEPIALLALIGNQMRRIYAAKLAYENRMGANYLQSIGYAKSEGQARMTMRIAEKFSLQQLKKALELLLEADYKCKSSGMDSRLILQDCVLAMSAL